MGDRGAGGVPGKLMLGGAVASLLVFLALTTVVTRHGLDHVDHVARALVHWYCCAPLQSSMEAASFLAGRPGQLTVVVFGSVLDSILLHTCRSQRLPRRLWPIVESQAECATHVWREPDHRHPDLPIFGVHVR